MRNYEQKFSVGIYIFVLIDCCLAWNEQYFKIFMMRKVYKH